MIDSQHVKNRAIKNVAGRGVGGEFVLTETLQADGDDSDLREGPQQGRCESDRKI